MSEPADGISLMVSVRNQAGTVAAYLGRWSEALSRLNRPTQLIVIDDGSTDGTVVEIEKAGLTAIRHDSPRGFGACVKSALAVSIQPIFGYIGFDYPYEPSDLSKLLAEFGKHNPDFNMTVDLVSGCRTGIAVPQPWKTLGWLKRQFYRWALGNPLAPLPGWYGVGEHLLNWRANVIYGNPFHDVNCAFKLFRKSRLETIPIQCDNDGVHIELVGKLTFLTTLMAEVPLCPKPDMIPNTNRRDLKTVSRSPQFRKLATSEPAIPLAVPSPS